jgi:hypothetical protein
LEHVHPLAPKFPRSQTYVKIGRAINGGDGDVKGDEEKRSKANLTVNYEGGPTFAPIPETTLQYATNTATPVIMAAAIYTAPFGALCAAVAANAVAPQQHPPDRTGPFWRGGARYRRAGRPGQAAQDSVPHARRKRVFEPVWNPGDIPLPWVSDVVGLLVRPEFYETNEKAKQERELPVSKEKAPCGLLGGFSGRLESGRTKVQAFLIRASPGIVGSIAQIR